MAGRPAVDLVGRAAELDRLSTHARSSEGLLILAAPGAGTSELLKQTYDKLFLDQQDVVPFYFPIRPAFTSGRAIARSFLEEFIRQLVAFRRQDTTVVRSAIGLDELSELALSIGGFWIDRLVENARDINSSDDRSVVRTCLGALIRAAANGERSFVIIDNAHMLKDIDGGLSFFEEFKEIFAGSGVSFAIAGYRRFLYATVESARMELDVLKGADAASLVNVLAKENRVAVTEPARDLVATQLGGNASHIAHLILTAKDSRFDLNNFENVEKAYANSIFGGRIAREFDRRLASCCRDAETERRVLGLLSEMQRSESGRIEIELWRRRLRLSDDESAAMLDRLNIDEVVRQAPGFVEGATENIALADHVSVRVQLMTSATRASVYGDSLTQYIKRAPELMARTYRANWSVGVREVLGAFGGQTAPSVLLDYDAFRRQLKGAADDEIMRAMSGGPTMTLPRIFFTTTASAFYRPIAKIAEAERSAIALGFEASDNDGDSDIVWIAAEIDSKLEASAEVVEFWCDRLEAAAVMCDFTRFRIWLIARDGFTPDAIDVLRRRKAYGSSRRQVELLRHFLDAPVSMASHELAENEYEMVIPMGDDAELVAAHAVEEIARRHKFDQKSINQIKTALVEACINASEHSLSPDNKIYQRFRIDDDRVVLTISNRGLRLVPNASLAEPTEGRRGWGLRLMRELMDEVTIESVDDGTRIVMTKFMKAA